MIKKLLKVVVLVIVATFVVGVAGGQSYESMDAASLRREVQRLLKTTKSQKEEIALLEKSLETQGATIAKYQRTTKAQETTIAQLRRRLAKPKEDVAGPVPEAEKPNLPGVVMYKGKERSESWIKLMHRKFADKIVYHDGRFILIKGGPPQSINLFDPKLGDLAEFPGYKVSQGLGNGQALIAGSKVVYGFGGVGQNPTSSRRPSPTYHVAGLAHKAVDGKRLPDDGPFVLVGTYEYVTVLGAKATVESFVPVKTLTMEQFRNALASGVELIEYETRRSRRGDRVIEKPIR